MAYNSGEIVLAKLLYSALLPLQIKEFRNEITTTKLFNQEIKKKDFSHKINQFRKNEASLSIRGPQRQKTARKNVFATSQAVSLRGMGFWLYVRFRLESRNIGSL